MRFVTYPPHCLVMIVALVACKDLQNSSFLVGIMIFSPGWVPLVELLFHLFNRQDDIFAVAH